MMNLLDNRRLLDMIDKLFCNAARIYQVPLADGLGRSSYRRASYVNVCSTLIHHRLPPRPYYTFRDKDMDLDAILCHMNVIYYNNRGEYLFAHPIPTSTGDPCWKVGLITHGGFDQISVTCGRRDFHLTCRIIADRMHFW